MLYYGYFCLIAGIYDFFINERQKKTPVLSRESYFMYENFFYFEKLKKYLLSFQSSGGVDKVKEKLRQEPKPVSNGDDA